MDNRVKILEIRDEGTLIPALAFLVQPVSPVEDWLIRRAGYGGPPHELVMLAFLIGDRKARYDPYAWNDRTMTSAHQFIQDNWAQLESGAVVDVEFILGEKTSPKPSGNPSNREFDELGL